MKNYTTDNNDNNNVKFEAFVGLDVHKDSIAVAVAYKGDSEPISLGIIPSDEDSVIKLFKKAKLNSLSTKVAYEAGPTGYSLFRYLNSKNITTLVVAPSLIPKAPSDKIKTDKRDATKLAELLRSNLLTPIYIPNESDEALLNLTRYRITAVKDRTRAINRLKLFLLKSNITIPPEVPHLTRS